MADPPASRASCASARVQANNDRPGSAKRIAPGTYPLETQFGRYVSVDYSTAEIAGIEPMPAFALTGTEPRDGILVHPAYPWGDRPDNLYLSSVGCLNPAGPLAADADNDFFDLRRRVIELIDSLRRLRPSRSPPRRSAPTPPSPAPRSSSRASRRPEAIEETMEIQHTSPVQPA